MNNFKIFLIVMVFFISACGENNNDRGFTFDKEVGEEKNNKDNIKEKAKVEDNNKNKKEEKTDERNSLIDDIDYNYDEDNLYKIEVDKNYIKQPKMNVEGSVNIDKYLFYAEDEFFDKIEDINKEKLSNSINEYNLIIKKIYNDFKENRIKTYKEFENYYIDYNNEIKDVLEKINILCNKESKKYKSDSCNNIKAHKNNILNGYSEVLISLKEIIKKMNNDELEFYKNYKEELNDKIKKAKK